MLKEHGRRAEEALAKKRQDKTKNDRIKYSDLLTTTPVAKEHTKSDDITAPTMTTVASQQLSHSYIMSVTGSCEKIANMTSSAASSSIDYASLASSMAKYGNLVTSSLTMTPPLLMKNDSPSSSASKIKPSIAGEAYGDSPQQV